MLRLAKTAAPLRFIWTWPDVDVTALDPAMVIICREPDGRWYVTFTIDAAGPEPLPAAGHAVGVDLGLKDFAVTSDGRRIANPRHLQRRARNLARYQRRLTRCRPGCRPMQTRRAGKLIAGTVIYRLSGQKGGRVGVAVGDFEDLVRRYRPELHVWRYMMCRPT